MFSLKVRISTHMGCSGVSSVGGCFMLIGLDLNLNALMSFSWTAFILFSSPRFLCLHVLFVRVTSRCFELARRVAANLRVRLAGVA